jgi:hypothetical protein
MKVYHGLFDPDNKEGYYCKMFDEFGVPLSERDSIEIIYAAYDISGYEGDAHVIFIKEGKLYEVNGSHCSCNGLDNSWIPEETSIKALLFRPNVSKEAKDNIKEKFADLIPFI